MANDANSVGYLSHGMLNDKIKAVKVDGQVCTTESIQGGKYLLVRPIYLLVKGEASLEIKGFIDYILSAEGQQTIKTSGLIPAK